MDETGILTLKRRFDYLKGDTERANYEHKCEQIAEVILPRKRGFRGEQTAGDKRMQKVYDSTGIHANETLSAGLHGLATNPSARWFALRAGTEELDDEDGVKQWLSEVEELMFVALYAPGSQFTTAVHELYLELGGFGTGVLFVGQRESDGRLLFQPRSINECIISENADGVVDTVFRKTTYTVRQMVETFGLEKVSDKVREMHSADKMDDKCDVIHAVTKRTNRDTTAKGQDNMPFMSVYFEYTTDHELKEEGFPEFPYLVPRWTKLPGEYYGRGRGEVALPDVRMLQAMMLTGIKTMQKNADPPMWLPDDGVIGPVRTVPGGINYYRGNRDISLHPTNPQGLSFLGEWQEQVRQRIRDVFHTDVLSVQNDKQMTAFEVDVLNTRRMQMLGPVIGRLESEFLGPLVTRVFGIMYRAGQLPDPPDELIDDEGGFDIPLVEYVSPVATAQKQSQSQALTQVAQNLQLILGPEGAAMAMQKVYSPERTVEWLSELFNVDPELQLTDDEKKEAAAQEEQMQQQATLPAMADSAQKGAQAVKGLSEAGLDVQGLMNGEAAGEA